MKKILLILFFTNFIFSYSLATIYSCKIDDTFSNGMKIKADIVINVNNNTKEKLLITTDYDNLSYQDNDIIMSNGLEQKRGDLIVTFQSGGFLRKRSYDLFATRNNKPGSNNYFTAIFNEGAGIVHSLTTSPWNMKIYMFISDQPQKLFKGQCS